MGRVGKKYAKAREVAKAKPQYALQEAVATVTKAAFAKFDETVDVAVRLGVDPRHADQVVRGTVVLPHGTGKPVRVLVITQGERVREAEAAGADFVGLEYLQKLKDGWLDCDVIVATPDVMGQLGTLGRVLGPRGLMPNPKAGTVTMDVAKAVREIKAGLGLAEAKALVEGAPKPVLEGANKADSDAGKKKLEEAGAKVEVK